jgi:hypothetical protein
MSPQVEIKILDVLDELTQKHGKVTVAQMLPYLNIGLRAINDCLKMHKRVKTVKSIELQGVVYWAIVPTN